ncbi:MAG: hypothetical protein WC518_01165 [Patescibacteria group bacterium]
MKKLLTYVVVVATIAWSLGLASVVPMASAAYAPTAGDKVKVSSSSAVYYVDADSKKHLFSTQSTFESWYGLVSSSSSYWSQQGIKTITQEELDALSNGSNVNIRQGSLIKFSDSAAVYAVSTGSKLYTVKNGDAATTLFGSNWSTKLLKVVNSFRAGYYDNGNAVGELTASSKLPDGFLVKYSGSDDTVYYLRDGKKDPLTDDAFVANKLKDNWVITVPSSITYDNGSSVTGADAELTTVAGPGSVVPPSSGSSLSVALASDTPAAGLAIYSAIRVPFTTVAMTASSDGDITVDSLTVERKGASADANFASVAIIDADTNVQIGVNQNLNASSKAVFSNDFVIKAGTTRKILLAGNMNAAGAGQVPALALSELVLSGSATVVGSLPITGNIQTMTSLTIGIPTVQRGSYMTSTSTDVKVGSPAYIVGAFKISADSTEGQRVKQIKFYNSGTAAFDSDIGNYKLLIDNSTPVTATFTKDGKYLTADFTNNSVLIEKGKNKEFVLKADILDGSTRTIKISIYRTTDVLASGDTFGYMYTPVYSGTSNSTSNPVLTNDQLTISTGTLRIESSSSVEAQDISYGDSQELGAFNLVVAGEPVSITALTLDVSSTTAGTTQFTNWKLVDKDGKTLWGPNDPASGTVAYTSSVQLPIGSNLVKVIADVESTGGWANNETFYFKITGSNITATGVTTNDTVTASPTGAVNANTQTFKPAKLTITANSLPVDGTATLGAKKFLYGSWALSTSGSGENIKVSAITFANQAATTTNLDSVTLYDVTNKTNCTTKYPNATLDSYGCLLMVKDGYSNTTTWTLTDPIIVTKNTNLTLELRADVRTTAATYQGHKDEFVIRNDGTTAPVTAVGTVTNNTVTPTGSGYNATDGADITIGGAGTITINTSVSQPASKLLAEGQTYEVGRLKLTATNEAIKVSDLNICVGTGSVTGAGDGDKGDISNIKVYKSTDMTTPLIDSAINAVCESFSLAQGALEVPVGSSGVELVIKATTAKVDNSVIDESGLANANFKLGIGGTDGIAGKGVNSGLSASETYTAGSSSAMILHRSYPTVTITTPTNKLVSGAVLYDFTVNNPTSEPVAIYKVGFYTSTSSGDIMVTKGGLDAKLPDWSAFKKIADDISTTTVFYEGGDTNGQYWSFILWNQDSTSETQKELRIPAGSNARFQFIGRTVSGVDGTAGESLQVSLLGDPVATSSTELTGSLALNFNRLTADFALDAAKQADLCQNNNKGNFVWSDLWSNDGTQATNTAQWYNGYLVDGLSGTSSVVSILE